MKHHQHTLDNKLSVSNLKSIPETLLIPLYMRYLESHTQNPLFNDESSIDAVKKIDFNFSKWKNQNEVQIGIAARTLIFDTAVKAYLIKHTDCQVVHLACGLDNRFSRVDNGKMKWYDLDLPEVMELRKTIYFKHERQNFIAGDLLCDSWHQLIPVNPNTLFIMEGILYYFSKPQVRKIITNLADNFKGAHVIFDVISKLYILFGGMQFHQLLDKKKDEVAYKWGFNGWDEIITWSPGIRFVEEWILVNYYGDRCPDRLKEAINQDSDLRKMFLVGHLIL